MHVIDNNFKGKVLEVGKMGHMGAVTSGIVSTDDSCLRRPHMGSGEMRRQTRNQTFSRQLVTTRCSLDDVPAICKIAIHIRVMSHSLI